MASNLLRIAQTISRGSVRSLSITPSLAIKPDIMHRWPAEKFDKHFIDYFNRSDIDGWEVRKAMTELYNFDLIPDPKIIEAALRACRRVNDFSLAVRFLENLKFKCGSKRTRAIMYPWLISQVQPVLDELGISTPEELGFDKPELFIPSPENWWEKEWYKDYEFDKMPGYKHFA